MSLRAYHASMSRPVRPGRVRLLYGELTVYLLNKTGRLDLGGLGSKSPGQTFRAWE
jgi:hypothetical protein